MTSVPPAFDRYLLLWNDPDEGALESHVYASCATDIIFADPNEYTEGHDDLLRMARKVRAEIPGAVYRRIGGVDHQNRRYRYLWEIELGGDILVTGMDVATLDDAGLIERIDGFFTPLPPPND